MVWIMVMGRYMGVAVSEAWTMWRDERSSRREG